jgi:hypothetical protein
MPSMNFGKKAWRRNPKSDRPSGFQSLAESFSLADNDSSCCLLPLRLLRFLLALDGQVDGSQALARNSVPIVILTTALPMAAPAGVLLEAI